jgi:uncharacterized membrane protein
LSSLVSIFVRLCIVLAGYACAILTASLFLHLLAWPSLGFEGDTPTVVAKTALVVSVLLIALLISYYAFLPAAVLIAIAEFRPFRSWLYFALAGGITALSALVLYETVRMAGMAGARTEAFGADSLLVALASGMIAGVAYWLVAGRSAGRWRERGEATVPEQSGS